MFVRLLSSNLDVLFRVGLVAIAACSVGCSGEQSAVGDAEVNDAASDTGSSFPPGRELALRTDPRWIESRVVAEHGYFLAPPGTGYELMARAAGFVSVFARDGTELLRGGVAVFEGSEPGVTSHGIRVDLPDTRDWQRVELDYEDESTLMRSSFLYCRQSDPRVSAVSMFVDAGALVVRLWFSENVNWRGGIDDEVNVVTDVGEKCVPFPVDVELPQVTTELLFRCNPIPSTVEVELPGLRSESGLPVLFFDGKDGAALDCEGVRDGGFTMVPDKNEFPALRTTFPE